MRRAATLFAPAILAAGVLAGTAHADPTYLPPYDGPGEFQTNQSPDKTGCAYRDSSVVISTPIWNINANDQSQDYTQKIGTADLHYSKYCQTKWIVTTLPETGTIYEDIWRNGNPDKHTDPQTDTATRAYTMQVYAPDNTSVSWEVKIYRNKYLVGWTQGICPASDGSCVGM